MGNGWVGRGGGKVRSQGGIVEGWLGGWLLTGRVFLLVGELSPTAHGGGLASAKVVAASAVVVIAAAKMVVATVTTSGNV